ncbi:MAG TPA: hypothetical protein VGO59_05870 [Verrucomicrobiae bacterium]|jgi:hypothetical protein
MSTLFRGSLAALAAALIAGCSTQPKVFYHAGDEAPPEFLAGGASLLLTNLDGFSAKVSGSMSLADGSRHPISGDLLERQGSLIYQPANPVKGKRARSEGGMFFIWNATDHAGFVLSDPLQAFAPASTSSHPVQVTVNKTGAIEESANGHPCRRMEAVVQSSDGSSSRYTIWEAEDARHFPVRIQSPAGPEQFTLNFFDLRLELPPPQLFTPPDGFMKYASPVSLMNELIIRQSAMAKRNEGFPLQMDPGDPNLDHWRPATPY